METGCQEAGEIEKVLDVKIILSADRRVRLRFRRVISLETSSQFTLTFRPGLHDLAHHPVPVLVDADHLELVAGPGTQVVDLDLPGVWRVDRQLDPVRHPRVLLPVPGTREEGEELFC